MDMLLLISQFTSWKTSKFKNKKELPCHYLKFWQKLEELSKF